MRIKRTAVFPLTLVILLFMSLLTYTLWMFTAVPVMAAHIPAKLVDKQLSVKEIGAVSFTNASAATPIIDGQVDAEYGAPIASDPSDPPQGNAPMDLGDLYVTHDDDFVYFAFTVFENVGTTNWGKYLMYIDTTGDADGATSDAWGRNVTVNDPHKPEFSINTYLDDGSYGTEDIQFWSWNQGSTSWSNIGTIDAAALGTGVTSTIEWQVARTDLGNPDTIWVEVYSTGGGGGDNAQDTINNPADDWNATDWGTTAVLSVTTQYNFNQPIIVDGQIDAGYGSPLASDPADAPQGNVPMDLLDLYITDDADNYYFAYTINDDFSVTNWGKYIFYVDTTNDGNGATSDAWGRNVVVNDPHKPEFSINTWVDAQPYGTEDIQFWSWNGASWDGPTTIISAAMGTGAISTLEWAVSKASLGNPTDIWLEVYSTGGGGGDNAQDTINDPADDWNATDWSTTAVLLNSTQYPPAPPPSGEGCQSGAAQDGNIFWADLGHNSRDALYRIPGGPVGTNTSVTLRLRSACDDLTSAQVRVWNDRINVSNIYNLQKVASDNQYDWWEVKVPPSAVPTIYWYRFIARDGSATAYHEDDSSRDGGWGQTFGDSPDNSWQLTMYDPSFQSPDWVKDAIIYQIFPDRFRDGDVTNDPEPGRFFYDELDGTIYRSDPTGGVTNTWNTAVCDPRDENDCPGTYSLNYYGGDLQGVIDELDYLDDLGVTAIYFNPIFESPSNHKYDTANYSVISQDFGDLSTFITLTQEAHNRGINIILDGVFNHTSSDSFYFDRYFRYDADGNLTSTGIGTNDGSGACESPNSPFRDWYYFTDVAPGTGTCAGSDGSVNGAIYESWFGFESLPKLNAANQDVRDLIYSGSITESIALYWMEWADGWRFDVGADIDPGVTNDPTNTFWEEFRAAVHAQYPDTYMVIEEWGNASPWTLGPEMDATMNYQYSSAMMSFWRDSTFVDNDHNSGSSAGVLAPLTPSELDGRLQNWQERYPPEAYYAMMNLLGSHDTNRPLFMLDHNAAVGTDDTPLQNPAYDWSDAMQRQKGVVILQMTLPGAPTIYYGDEVGLVGPVYYDGSTWQDDPYNRQPFPWLDETGTPFYNHLQTQNGQDELRDHYRLLTQARNNHEALRTGSFDTLLVDDAQMLYGYGRKTATDAAIVIVNRDGTIASPISHTVALTVAGYVPYGAVFSDTLSGDVYTVDGSGVLTVDVPGQSGVVMVLMSVLDQPPAAPVLSVTGVRSEEVDLGWTANADLRAVPTATSYNIYRSLVSGGGYALITNTTGLTYTDSGLQNAVHYYYVVQAVNDGNGLVSDYSNEATAVPAHDLSTAWYNLQWPPEITHTISTITPTENIYGQLYIAGATGPTGPATGIMAQVGYAVSSTTPITQGMWTWVDMSYFGVAGNNDEFVGNLLPDQLGDFLYATRYSSDGGVTWYYADLSGPGYNYQDAGVLHVVSSGDLTPPAAPQNLMVEGTTPSSISFSWEAVTGTADLAGYEIYRQDVVLEGGFMQIATVATDTTSYDDFNVTTDESYNYYVQAFDTSFNRSNPSNIITATAEARIVTVTFTIGVPAYTPGTVYIVGSIPEFGPWNPGLVPMTQISSTAWTYSLPLLDGTELEYKFTRGNWETVEQWGSITGLANRELTIEYGTAGTMLVDLTATDWGNGPDDTKAVRYWRDPIVVDYVPAADAVGVSVNTAVTVTWSFTMNAATDFTVLGPTGAVAGAFATNISTTVFTPDEPLFGGSLYDVMVAGASTVGGDVQQVPVSWSFTTELSGTIPPASVTIAGATAGEVAVTYNFTATIVPTATTTPITVTWYATDQPMTQVVLTDTTVSVMPYSWMMTGTKLLTVTAANGYNVVTDTHLITISAELPPVALTEVQATGPVTALVGTDVTFTAVAQPANAAQPITYTWEATGQTAVIHTSDLTDTVSFNWADPGTKTITVTAANGVSVVTDVITIEIEPIIIVDPFWQLYLPFVAKNNS